MVQPQELRYGNNVCGVNGCIYTVYEICASGISYDCPHHAAEHAVWDEIRPLPITPELLHHFGFIYDTTNGTQWIDLQTHYLELMPTAEGWYPTYAQMPELSSESEQRVSSNRIHFFHQLQNLFYSLTGKELQVLNPTT